MVELALLSGENRNISVCHFHFYSDNGDATAFSWISRLKVYHPTDFDNVFVSSSLEFLAL